MRRHTREAGKRAPPPEGLHGPPGMTASREIIGFAVLSRAVTASRSITLPLINTLHVRGALLVTHMCERHADKTGC